MTDVLETPAQYIKGVGPKKYQLLNKLGIKTINDLLFYFPRRHEDRSKFFPISQLKLNPGEYHTVKGIIKSLSIFRTKSRTTLFQLAVTDGTGVLYAIWFNQPYLRKYFKEGDNIILYGKVERQARLQMYVPEYELINDQEDINVHIGRIVPIYPLTESVRQRMVRLTAFACVEEFSRYIKDYMPSGIKINQHLIDLKSAIRHIHFPTSFDTLKNARHRLIFDEFFFLQTALALKKAHIKLRANGISHNIDGSIIKSFLNTLPFVLTGAQHKVMEHIQKDMQSPRPMCRLLQGDVGSGKTIVAAYAIVISAQNNFQSAIMAPTEILAQQHYNNLSRLLLPLGIKIGLLTSGLTLPEKNRMKKLISQGEIDLVVGTHSLLEEDVKFKNLSLAVIDEQHKFGVAQRMILSQKGANPDILVMTATPIPRTLALTVYGDLDISIIDQMPPGRMPAKTYLFAEEQREKVYKFMRQEVKIGRQVFVIYPLIDKSKQSPEFIGEDVDKNGQMVLKMSRAGSLNLKAATKMYEDFKTKIFPDLKIGLIHGRMSKEEKDKVLEDFRTGIINILVSTIVVEVGIDMPNASVMVVEHAERFGLSQLHQLRGRIGRSSHQSYCILLADAKTDNAKMRMDAMLETHDGFKIAQKDLEIRGPGEFMGTRQHGLPDFKIGDIIADIAVLETAKKEAFDLVRSDPALSRPENIALRSAVAKKFGVMKDIGL